ncbi:uncharacterized protein L3040_001154 [Drepanopeziza brunnea f. sp. 'multigermtubi']|uniref:uncharacterized protein n=1 Tax=Drepanopeziza brunnea f. sp. 'multigermtubi' TaxID=698441 RepID=UPI0023879B4F|nr:hypothetical protein L3040_001154 [Drepanopeziza brunnea f. sp. 'multigermtubi']
MLHLPALLAAFAFTLSLAIAAPQGFISQEKCANYGQQACSYDHKNILCWLDLQAAVRCTALPLNPRSFPTQQHHLGFLALSAFRAWK